MSVCSAASVAYQIILLVLANVLTHYERGGHTVLNEKTIKDSYDFVVVGGGTAGCVVASRLSEISDFNILLIEVGGDTSAYSDIGMFGTMDYASTSLLPEYSSTKQDHICGSTGGICSLFWSRVLGGSSVTGGLNFVRSFDIDYEEWAAQGAKGWSFKDVFPYYKKMETFHPSSGLAYDEKLRGKSGPMQITNQEDFSKEVQAALEASKEDGFEIKDPNVMKPGRIAYYHQRNQFNGVKVNTKRAYLGPSVISRKNLDVVTFSRATKINFDGKKALSVDYETKGEKRTVKIGKEVILTAGSVETPKLLMLSGVGDSKDLSKLNIPVVNDLPGVGKQLHDHILFDINYELDHLAFDPVTNDDVKQYNEKVKQGILSKFYKLFNLYYSVHEDERDVTSTIEIGFPEDRRGPSFPLQQHELRNRKSRLQNHVKWLTPQSEGTITLSSKDPHDDPLIDGRWLADPDDRIGMRETVLQALKYFDSPSWRSVGLQFLPFDAPACEHLVKFGNRSNEYLDCVIQQLSMTDTHFCRTCRMGDPKDPLVVTLPESLKVKGLENVRIMDSSVMPQITRGNTLAPVVMIAEKGSDIVKGDYGKSTESPVLPLDYDTRILPGFHPHDSCHETGSPVSHNEL